MTLAVHWSSRFLLEVVLTYHFIDLSPNVVRTLRREVWLARGGSTKFTLFPFISTTWGFAEVDMQFVGFLKHSRSDLNTYYLLILLQLESFLA